MPQSPPKFTKRERDILKLRARGWSSADIAREEELSLQTINKHLRRCEIKAGGINQFELVLLLILNPGLLERAAQSPAPGSATAREVATLLRGDPPRPAV